MNKKSIIIILVVMVIVLAGATIYFAVTKNSSPEQTINQNYQPIVNQSDGITTYDSESWKKIIPESCKRFFDGCNNCERKENNQVSCTELGCFQYRKPECLD